MEDGTFESPGYPGDTEATSQPGGTSAAGDVRDLLDRIGDKWSVLVIELLGCEKSRFTELQRRIDGISKRMLSVTLRQLERDGLVSRTVHPVVPPRVDYALTPLGESVVEAIMSLVTWTREHRGEVAAARAAYDRRTEIESAGDG